MASRATPAAPPSALRALARRLGGATKTSLAIVGLLSVASAMSEAKALRDAEKEDAKDGKKRVLVLPFHRIKLVETKKPSLEGFLQKNGFSSGDDEENQIIEMEVKELVETIHEAAQDPNIVALYGIFGYGSHQFKGGGYAQIEEVRNALRVFRESHRTHKEPNLSYQEVLTRNGNGSPKPMYAFADSFEADNGDGNREYYLASIFTHLHLQNRGTVSLSGMALSNAFFKDFLNKYGMKVHVFKHGKYKNAPNMFTERTYTPEHKQNVKNLVDSVYQHTCDAIAAARNLKGFDGTIWSMIRNHGTFTAQHAHELGLVDYTTSLDPLGDLLRSNKEEEDGDSSAKEAIKSKWGKNTDVDKFNADESISVTKYASLVSKRKKREEKTLKRQARLKELAERSSAFSMISRSTGMGVEDAKVDASKEKIALLTLAGGISDSMALKTIGAIRKIKTDEDIKCIVLRVDSPGGSATSSETILQELKDAPQPVVCSMGNSCASGGYYIATGANRLFALPNTITGSIGVFGIKADFTDFAKRYGIRVQHVGTGPLSTAPSLFSPLTKPMKADFSRSVDHIYHNFKSIVAESRGMDMDQVESVAGGRIWTGEQAKAVGLVDEVGGLSRAMAYAKRTYASEGATVETWPKEPSLRERFMKRLSNADDVSVQGIASTVWQFCRTGLFGEQQQNSSKPTTTTTTADRVIPSSVSGTVLTVDETTGLQHLLRERSLSSKQDYDEMTLSTLIKDTYYWRS